MQDEKTKEITVTCVKENEDGSADVEVEVGPEVKDMLIDEGVNFILLKGMLGGNTEDILRWAQCGKQEEQTSISVKKFNENYNEDTK